jgi:hypothetical protein
VESRTKWGGGNEKEGGGGAVEHLVKGVWEKRTEKYVGQLGLWDSGTGGLWDIGGYGTVGNVWLWESGARAEGAKIQLDSGNCRLGEHTGRGPQESRKRELWDIEKDIAERVGRRDARSDKREKGGAGRWGVRGFC